jgi:hypothetical protein
MSDKIKLVAQLDKDGFYVAPTEAHECVLEPGVFHIPGGAVECPPPVVPVGKRAKYLGNGDWEFSDIPSDVVLDDPDAPDQTPALTPAQQDAVWLATAVLSKFQFKMGLHEAGLLEKVEALMADPDTSMMVKLAWADSQEFRRNSPTVKAIAAGIEISDKKLDKLFLSVRFLAA